MQSTELNELIRILQTALSPIALVSGIGLLVLSMTNRFAHTTDRARLIVKQLREADPPDNCDRLSSQVKILYKRSQVLLMAISFALTSVLFASLLIVSLFGTYLTGMNLRGLVIGLFVVSLFCLVASVVLFIEDMSLSLKALREELRGRV